jgi:hypothetical protein
VEELDRAIAFSLNGGEDLRDYRPANGPPAEGSGQAPRVLPGGIDDVGELAP